MRFRENGADVLQQLSYFKAATYYWIDAICIEQDAVNEKNHQVAIMESIFQRAQHVLLCVGDYNDDGGYCVEAIIDRLEQTPDTVDSLMDGTTDFKPVVLNDADPPPGDMYRNWNALKTLFKI